MIESFIHSFIHLHLSFLSRSRFVTVILPEECQCHDHKTLFFYVDNKYVDVSNNYYHETYCQPQQLM
jgi:hypothetical protein